MTSGDQTPFNPFPVTQYSTTMVICVVLLAVVGVSHAAKQYTLNTVDGKSFSVSINNTLILQHSAASPLVFVGDGLTNFIEGRGNFFISNYVQDRIGLPQFNVTSFNQNDVIVLQLPGSNITATVTLTSSQDQDLVMSVSTVLPYVWLRVAATKEEKVYGLGEQYSYLNLRGRTYPIWTREQGVGRNKSDIVTFFADKIGHAGGDYHTTYFPQPTFVSSRKYYCHYTGSNYVEANLLPSDFHELFIYGNTADLYFNTENSIKSVVTSLTGLLGRQPELPDWVYTGAILGVQGGTDLMLERMHKAQRNEVPVSGLWIQDWAGILNTSFGKRLFWDWKWNPTLYPNLTSVIKELRTYNIRVFAYINPNLNNKGDLFKEADSHGYLVKNATTGDSFLMDFGEFFCGIVDMTNPDAYDWYKGVIQTNMIDLGFGGWMADFGEYLPADGVHFYNNQSAKEVHNTWPLRWAQLNRDAIDGRNKTGEVVFWMRAGAAGSGNYTTIMWAGDQNVDFSYGDGLASTIPAALNMGMSGIGITHFDIGGYTTYKQFAAFGQALVRTEELLLRSAEAAVFTPMFRTHEGNQPEANVQFYTNDYVEQSFGRLARLFVYISNYTRHLVEDNSLFGIPVQRPLFMEFPDDPKSWTITYQYMFGEDVLVAPVIEANVTTAKVYLPPGNWKSFWNDSSLVLSGGRSVSVRAPLGLPPAFYIASSTWAPLFQEIESRFPVLLPPPTTTSAPVNGVCSFTSRGYSVIILVLTALYSFLNMI